MTLPETPSLPRASEAGYVRTVGAKIWYAVFGRGPTVTLLHGGLANSNYWARQVRVLSKNFKVVVIDTRGHGRSSSDDPSYSYLGMTDDVVAVLEHLKIRRTALVGWSDGAIVGLYLAIRKPHLFSRLFAFAGNFNPEGVTDVKDSPVFKSYFERVESEYKVLSATPDKYPEFSAGIIRMWETQPNIQPDDLRAIRLPVWIVDGDHDEAIKRSHTEELASYVPGSGLLILPEVSHFAFIQDSEQFNTSILHFLRPLLGREDGIHRK